jgi:hypothetical protein
MDDEKMDIKLLNRKETLEYIARERCSIARFGDGEVALAFYHGIDFQKADSQLCLRLQQILIEPIQNVLVCFNNDFMMNDEYKVVLDYERTPKDYCRFESVRRLNDIAILSRGAERCLYQRQFASFRKRTKLDRLGDATCFMLCFFYNEYVDGKINEIAELYRSLFSQRNILFVCPESPLMGMSFRKLYDAGIIHSIRNADFITIPEKNCFSYYDKIVKEILSYKLIDAVFIQAGPTATVLVADLMANHGILAYDMGSWNTSLEKASVVHNICF